MGDLRKSSEAKSAGVKVPQEQQSEQGSSMLTISVLVAAVAAAAVGTVYAKGSASFLSERWDTELTVPPNSVFVDPLSIAVLGSDGPFRNGTENFNPTNDQPPFFQIFNKEFLNILGPNPSIKLLAQNSTFAFAHEAPIYVPETQEVFFSSNDGGALGMSGLNENNRVSKISLKGVDNLNGQVQVTPIPLSDTIQMTNGGTPFRNQLLLINSGRGTLPSNIALVNPFPPYNSTILLDNFIGRQFNSLNDAKIHPKSKAIFFTDSTYGVVQNFKPAPAIPNQVYRFVPETGEVKVVATDFVRSNGIAFSNDGSIAYVTDTGENIGFFGNNGTLPATIYAYDVDHKSQVFKNKRLFAYADSGIPDGIQVDSKGNVYSGCGDGVHVWDPDGTFLGKIFLGTTSANMVFAAKGQLVILAETAIYLAEIAATGPDLNFT